MTDSVNGIRRWFSLIAVVSLTACASFPITSMYKLRHFNPATTDIQHFRFAVRVPEDIEIPEDGIRLLLGTEHSERANLQETFYLEQTNDRTALASVERKGTQTQAFRIGSDDVERFRRLRQLIRIEKANGADGILEVKADVCRTKPDLPSHILVSTFVSASETKGYVALMLNVDMLSRIEQKTALEMAPECINQ